MNFVINNTFILYILRVCYVCVTWRHARTKIFQCKFWHWPPSRAAARGEARIFFNFFKCSTLHWKIFWFNCTETAGGEVFVWPTLYVIHLCDCTILRNNSKLLFYTFLHLLVFLIYGRFGGASRPSYTFRIRTLVYVS